MMVRATGGCHDILMVARTIKSCGCGRIFTREQWDQLEQLSDWLFTAGPIFEVRNCPCGSTLIVDVPCLASPISDAVATGARGHHHLAES